MRTTLALLAAVLLLGGCASSRTIAPGETRGLFGDYEVRATAAWTRARFRNLEMWTVDGPQLQQLRFYRAMDTDDTLYEVPVQTVIIPPSLLEKRPRYREGMQPHDVDVKALLRIAVLYNVPTACNRATADFIVSSSLLNQEYRPVLKDYSQYIGRGIDMD